MKRHSLSYFLLVYSLWFIESPPPNFNLWIRKKKRDQRWSLSIVDNVFELIVSSLKLEVSLRVSANRTYFRSVFADVDVATVEAMPDAVAVA